MANGWGEVGRDADPEVDFSRGESASGRGVTEAVVDEPGEAIDAMAVEAVLLLAEDDGPGNGELRKVLSLFFHFLTPPPDEEDVDDDAWCCDTLGTPLPR